MYIKMKTTKLKFSDNGEYLFNNIQGDIKKIVIVSKQIMQHTNVEFVSESGEHIFKTTIENTVIVKYPVKYEETQDRNTLIYNWGDLGIKIDGLQEGESIDSISVFYSD